MTMSTVEIIQADFAVTLARVAEMGGADLILTSPPYRGTLWWYATIGNGHDDSAGEATDHPARFCLRFAEDAVRCFCPPGGLVCDPFSGSGTSAVAAAKHGRRFFGGDLLNRPRDGKPWSDVGLARVRKAELSRRIQILIEVD